METWLGNMKKAIIIPEIDYNKGWGILQGRYYNFGKALNIRFLHFADVQNKKYIDA